MLSSGDNRHLRNCISMSLNHWTILFWETMCMYIFGLKLNGVAVDVKVIKILRAVNSRDSISEIKRKIQQNDFIYTCSCTDYQGISMMLSIFYQLQKQKVSLEIYEKDGDNLRLTTTEFLKNLLNSYSEIYRYMGRIMYKETEA